MTYPAPERVPYDEWFDPNYKYNPDPDEEMDLAPSSVEPQDEEETMHEKAYKIATSKYNPFSIGGSENIHDFDRKD
jgi:hypothetical protein